MCYNLYVAFLNRLECYQLLTCKLGCVYVKYKFNFAILCFRLKCYCLCCHNSLSAVRLGNKLSFKGVLRTNLKISVCNHILNLLGCSGLDSLRCIILSSICCVCLCCRLFRFLLRLNHYDSLGLIILILMLSLILNLAFVFFILLQLSLVYSLLKYNICLSGLNSHILKCDSPRSLAVCNKISACCSVCNRCSYLLTIFFCDLIECSAYYICSILCKTCVRDVVNNSHGLSRISCYGRSCTFSTYRDSIVAVLNLNLCLDLTGSELRDLIICKCKAVAYITVCISVAC